MNCVGVQESQVSKKSQVSTLIAQVSTNVVQVSNECTSLHANFKVIHMHCVAVKGNFMRSDFSSHFEFLLTVLAAVEGRFPMIEGVPLTPCSLQRFWHSGQPNHNIHIYKIATLYFFPESK